jgi:ABC-type methionine transport system ATPase subunit
MNRLVSLFVCLLCVVTLAQDAATTQPANLVRNGDFAEAKDKIPAKWRLPEAGNEITVDAQDKPANAAQVLKVHIKKAAEMQAAVTQVVRGVAPNTKLVLAGQMKGSDQRLGYLQVKLKKGGQEIDRKKSEWNTDDWKVHKVEFDTGEADELSIELRFSQNTKAADQKVRFADITLTKVQP